jgi:hypothetical protein
VRLRLDNLFIKQSTLHPGEQGVFRTKRASVLDLREPGGAGAAWGGRVTAAGVVSGRGDGRQGYKK